MTKLTKEQIEQERVKFNDFMKNQKGLDVGDINEWDMLSYGDEVQLMFDAWLARAELYKGE